MAKHLVLILIMSSLAFYPSSAGITMADEPFEAAIPAEITFLASAPRAYAPKRAPALTVWVTAYSSTPEETDDTPFITASNTPVRDGVIAANFLPFGTKVQIPSLFGSRVFVVEDRMHPTKSNFVDVWMPSKSDAIEFGSHRAEITVFN